MLISVCIPTYSRLEYLKLAVNSVFAQTYTNFEICVAQDPMPNGPSSEIMEWCEANATSNPKFRYQLNKENVGLAGNWNVLSNMAEGSYVIILGDDDTLEPTYLERLTRNIVSNKPDVVFCDQNFIDEVGNIKVELTEEMSLKYYRSNLQSGLLSNSIEVVLNNTVPMSSSLIKRHHLLSYPFDPTLNTPELEVFMKIAAGGGIFEYVKERLANYRVHQGSATSGGLKIHYLLRNIIPIKVPEAYEQFKYKLVSQRIIPAINICIREGDKKLAKQLLSSKYYPPGKIHLKLIQSILLACPAFIIKKVL